MLFFTISPINELYNSEFRPGSPPCNYRARLHRTHRADEAAQQSHKKCSVFLPPSGLSGRNGQAPPATRLRAGLSVPGRAGRSPPFGFFADGTGTAASFHAAIGVAVAPDGATVYVGDVNNHKIRKIVAATGVVSTLAGSGVAGSTDGAAATFHHPQGVAVANDSATVYVADATNHKPAKPRIPPGGGGL